MARDFIVPGPTLVCVRGGLHLSGTLHVSGKVTELGLSVGDITISPRFAHADIVPDDFGPSVPAEVMWNLAYVDVGMTLIHYDSFALDLCISESMGGVSEFTPGPIILPGLAGTLQPAGSVLGNGLPLFASGCHYMSLYLLCNPPPSSPTQEPGYRFLTCYLDAKPLTIPVGTDATKAVLNWRAIPYRPIYSSGFWVYDLNGNVNTQARIDVELDEGVFPFSRREILSSGAILWERLDDNPTTA